MWPPWLLGSLPAPSPCFPLRPQEESHTCRSSDGYTVANSPGQSYELPVAGCRSGISFLLHGFRERQGKMLSSKACAVEEQAPMWVGSNSTPQRITGDTSWLLLTPEAEPVENLLVFLVMVESRGVGGERRVMFPSQPCSS